MTDSHLNRETVERLRARLLDEYGDARVEPGATTVPADEFPDLLGNAGDGYVADGSARTSLTWSYN